MRTARLAILVSILWLLQACSSAPPPRVSQPQPNQGKANPAETMLSAEDYLEKARNGGPAVQKLWLLKAAQSWQATHCDNSIKIISVIAPKLVTPSQLTQAKLILAECYVQSQHYDEALNLLPGLSLQQGFDQRIFQLKATLFEYDKRYLQAANQVQKQDISDKEKSVKIWTLIQKVSHQELNKARLRYPAIQGWVQLSQIIRRKHSSDRDFHGDISDWQRRYPLLEKIMPQTVIQALETASFSPRNIAVLLPLSGRLKKQANAIKQGLLAAYFEQKGDKPELQFIDSNQLNAEELKVQLQTADFIIGPLLKDKIEDVIQAIPDTIPMLALNSPEQDNNPLHFFYGLAPEDEARQIASHLYNKGFRTPVIVSATNSAYVRMAAAFNQQWQMQAPDYQPKEVSFSDNKSMRNQVEGLLGVAQSKSRISAMEKYIPRKLHNVPRNRQDIDVIVVFAGAGETELLNPIIESSVSPFASLVPVYASSRSFSQDLSKNSLRDLRNLNFIDMPWILDKPSWKKQHSESKQLWPQRRDSLQRLYAMGYDSFNLVKKLKYMQLFPQFYSQQATGKLSMQNNRILRQLSWGKVLKNQVVHIGVE